KVESVLPIREGRVDCLPFHSATAPGCAYDRGNAQAGGQGRVVRRVVPESGRALPKNMELPGRRARLQRHFCFDLRLQLIDGPTLNVGERKQLVSIPSLTDDGVYD